MIDVHPPKHAVETWREFLIHIATIVIGLLIAIGLEQTVEYLHHRQEVAETREALHAERASNISRFAVQTDEFYRIVPVLKGNLAVFAYLRAHPGAAPDKWPAKLNWSNVTVHYYDAAWKTAQEDSVAGYMPHTEVQGYSDLYDRLEELDRDGDAQRDAIYAARSFSIYQPDPAKLTPIELDRQVELTTRALTLYAQTANRMANLSMRYSDFPHPPHNQPVGEIFHEPRDRDTGHAVADLVQRLNGYDSSQDEETPQP